MLTYISSVVPSLHIYTVNSASEHTNPSSLASADKTLQFIGGDLTSYQTLLSLSGCFSTCSAFQRNIAETFCAHGIFKEFFPSSLVNPPLCAWCTSEQQHNLSLCMLLLKEMLSCSWCLSRTEGLGETMLWKMLSFLPVGKADSDRIWWGKASRTQQPLCIAEEWCTL